MWNPGAFSRVNGRSIYTGTGGMGGGMGGGMAGMAAQGGGECASWLPPPSSQLSAVRMIIGA